MLNICMERRRIREGGLPFTMPAGMVPGKEGGAREGSHESEDEFFDCSDEDDEGEFRRSGVSLYLMCAKPKSQLRDRLYKNKSGPGNFFLYDLVKGKQLIPL